MRDGLNPLPDQGAKFLLLFGMKESFAVKLSMMSLSGEPDRADQRSVGSDHKLKISQMSLQIERGQSGYLPESNQRLQIVQGSPAHLITGRTHFAAGYSLVFPR